MNATTPVFAGTGQERTAHRQTNQALDDPLVSERLTGPLAAVGRELARRSRAAQGLPAQVRDEEAIAALVDLCQLPVPTACANARRRRTVPFG